MAHKKGAGSTKNGRDSNAKMLGVKILILSVSILLTSRSPFVTGELSGFVIIFNPCS